MQRLLDVLLDSVLDTGELVPFLLLTYLAMEAIEHGLAGSSERLIARADKTGPIVGALLGAVPQCGFSAMAATLYAGRVVSAGTLVAVILSTSDELVPVFMAQGADVSRLAAVIGAKVLIGLVVGLFVDVVLRALHRAGDGHPHIAELCERAHCHCGAVEGDLDVVQGVTVADATHTPATADGRGHTHPSGHDLDHAHDSESDHGGAHARAHAYADAHGHAHDLDCAHAPESDHSRAHAHAQASADTHIHDHAHDHTHIVGHPWRHILRSAAIHTVEVTAFIFVATFVFGLLIELVGEDTLAHVLSSHPVRATFLAALIGLIPNCGASVAIAQLFLAGILDTGPMLAGLLVSGGMGLLVLFRTNVDQHQNVEIVAFVYLVGVACGIAAQALGIAL